METQTLAIRFLNVIAFLFFLLVSLSILSGDLQKIVHFSSIKNEIGTFFLSLIISTIFAFKSISK